MRTNQFRVPQVYARDYDNICCDTGVGSSKIDFKKDRRYPTAFNRWMLAERKKRETKALDITCLKYNQVFLITPTKRITRNHRKKSKKYSYYEIL